MLNERIKQLRQSFNMNQVELAKNIGVSKQCISNWENDNIQPSIEMLIKLSEFFKVSCDYLLGMEHQKTCVKQRSCRQWPFTQSGTD